MTVVTLNTNKLYNKLGWCSCSSELIREVFEIVINEFLKSLQESHEGRHYGCFFTEMSERTGLDARLIEIVLLELDRLRITDHGSSVRGSWMGDLDKLMELCGEDEKELDE